MVLSSRHQIVDQRAQSAQIVSTKPGAARSRLGESVRLVDVGPGRQHRRQPAVGVVKHHTVLTPVLSACNHVDVRPALRMERMSDLERYNRAIVVMTGSC